MKKCRNAEKCPAGFGILKARSSSISFLILVFSFAARAAEESGDHIHLLKKPTYMKEKRRKQAF